MAGEIRIEVESSLGWLIIDHLERRNALTEAMWKAIPDRLSELDANEEVRVVILRGAGEEAFISGADISEFERTRSTPESVQNYDAITDRAYLALAEINKPVLAMIHGFCVGGGLALAASADLRFCSEDAKFRLPPARLGIGYSEKGLETFRNLVGSAATKQLIFTAGTFSAQQALAMGLVNGVNSKPDLEPSMVELARTIAANAPLTLQSAKIGLRELEREPGLRDSEAIERAIARCFESSDYREGVRAFTEKRPPEFQGR